MRFKIKKYQYGNPIYSGLFTLDLKLEKPNLSLTTIPKVSSLLFPVPKLEHPNYKNFYTPGSFEWKIETDKMINKINFDQNQSREQINNKLENPSLMNLADNTENNTTTLVAARTAGAATDYLSGLAADKLFGESELGRLMGNIFSSGLSSAGNTVIDNLIKGESFFKGAGVNAGRSIVGAGAGLASNLIGQGISSLGGNSMLSRGVGQAVSTGLGSIGGLLVTTGKLTFQGKNLFSKIKPGAINPYALGASVIGSGLSAALGPSKEYNGRYGAITKTMDTIYDGAMAAAGFVPGIGQGLSGVMALNKGLSNLFGSTDGMTRQDAILGSAFMPAPVKWLNMLGSSKTGNFYNQSWLNSERADTFMQNAFGNLGDKFNLAREEAGKRYGTFSQGAKRRALDNLDFANYAWDRILAMADLNELLNIRSLYMTSINNLRYAQMIQGGWNPLAIGKRGMKIFNNATNHNMGMRLLSAAALIDDKQMILSALAGTKLYGAKKFRAMSEEELRNRKPEIVVSQTTPKTAEELNAEWERTHPNGGNANPNLSRVSDLTSEAFNQTTKPPFTGQEYLEAAEAQRLKKIDKFHEAEKIGEAALMADLGVNVAAPLLLRGFRWAFNKVGLLVKIPMLKTSYSVGLPGYPHYYNPTTNQWDFSSAASDVKQGIDNLRKWMNNPVYRKAAEANKAEAEAMGLTYIPYYERPEYIRALENPNIKFKNLNSSVGGESNLSGEVTINTGTTLNPTLVVRHEMGHVAGLGKISESAAINHDNTLLLKELKYLRHKSNQVYKEGSEYAGQVDLNRNSFEGIQNARDFGEELGIKIGQEYPGYEKALEIVNSYPENGFKAGLKKMFRLDKEHMPYVWKALAGTLFTLATTLYNTNK